MMELIQNDVVLNDALQVVCGMTHAGLAGVAA